MIGAAASALPSHGRGHRFDSYITHNMFVFAVFYRVFFLFIDVRALKLRERHDLFSAFCTIFRSNMVQKAEVFPGFVRNLGGIWYKVRKYRSRRLAAEFRKAGNKRPRAIAPGLCLLVYSTLARAS